MDKNEIFDSVEDCIAEFKRGGIVIVSDDENRENEGDMICAGEKITVDGKERQLPAEYKDMMTGLYIYQKKDEGCWAQLIDHTDMWTETSGSAMFAYAFITGVMNGWLDAEIYGKAARMAWTGLVPYLDDNYDLREVCAGTGTGSTVGHYESRERTTGDTHGQAGMLWCTYALTQLRNEVESGL